MHPTASRQGPASEPTAYPSMAEQSNAGTGVTARSGVVRTAPPWGRAASAASAGRAPSAAAAEYRAAALIRKPANEPA